MKKILMGALIASTALMAAGTASAGVSISADNFKPYVGLDYNYLSGLDKVAVDNLEGIKPFAGHVNVLGVTFGVQLNDYIGVEASYGKAVQSLKDNTINSQTSVDNIYGYDANGDQTVVGSERHSNDFSAKNTKFEHITVGLTGQYPIADQVYVKALVGAAWQRFDSNYEVNESWSYDDGQYSDSASENTSLQIASHNDAVFLGKVGLGYQASENSVFEINYTREGKLNGVGLQYKYVF